MMRFLKKCTDDPMTSKSRGYKLTPRAMTDLEEIWQYTVKTWSIKQADAYYNSIVTAFEALVSGGKEGRLVDIRPGYLKYAVGSHFIYYRKQAEKIIVVRVLHRRMDADRYL
jgi:toxin ParE1/3/4